MPLCLIGMEACVHHLSHKLRGLGHDAWLMPAKYVRPYSKGQKNDFRDAEAIAEAVQRPTMEFVAGGPFRLGSFRGADRHDPVKSLVAGLVGSEFQSELLAHHSGEKPTDRVPLPARHRHDGLDGRALGAPKQGDDLGLLGASAATGNGGSGGPRVAASPTGVGDQGFLLRTTL